MRCLWDFSGPWIDGFEPEVEDFGDAMGVSPDGGNSERQTEGRAKET